MKINNMQSRQNSPEFKGRFLVLVKLIDDTGKKLSDEAVSALSAKVKRGIRRGCAARSIESHICPMSSNNGTRSVTQVVTGNADFAEFCEIGKLNRDAFFSGAAELDADALVTAINESKFNFNKGEILDYPVTTSRYVKMREALYDARQWLWRKLTN